MPLLPREPDIYPENLLSDDPRPDPSRQWRVIYTFPRREKELMRRLLRMQIPFYCPLIKRRQRSTSGRARFSYIPLFAGYVFTCANEDQRYQTLTTNCVSRCLDVPDAGELIRDLRQIQQLIQSEAPLTPEARIEPGTRIRVRSGPLMGMEGTVVKRRGMQRLLVMVHFLQQGASVQFDDYQVEQIEG